MDAAEFAAWDAGNRAMYPPRIQATSPCQDCPRWFADEMGASGLCDGKPGVPQRQLQNGYSYTAEYRREKARKYRRQHGAVDVKERSRKRIAQAVALRDAGLANVEIARRLGVCRQAVSRYFTKAMA
jgi:hypothetical protein